jgi:hypothetical protein
MFLQAKLILDDKKTVNQLSGDGDSIFSCGSCAWDADACGYCAC